MPDRATKYDPPDSPSSGGWTEAKHIRLFSEGKPFNLEAGETIGPIDIEYETYGELPAAKDNVILVAHARSGDAHAAGWDKQAKETGRTYRIDRPGWWDAMIGPGKPLDTNRFHVMCMNYLGSCYGTTGPSSIDPETGKPYGLRFPEVTVNDWVRLQAEMLSQF